jgi:Ca2+-transporting ATPase
MALLGEVAESVVEPLQLLLVVVGVLSAIFGELRDAIAIFAVIALVSAVEAISEVRAKRALRALRDLSAPNALVRRERAVAAVPVDALVVGDVLLVEAGSVVAADARVVEADGLATDESRLTGEPVAAAKGPEPVDADAPLAERSSLVHAGSAVVAGAGEGVVVAVGAETEIGRLGRLVAEAREPPTPLQRAMAELARAALIVAVTAKPGGPVVAFTATEGCVRVRVRALVVPPPGLGVVTLMLRLVAVVARSLADRAAVSWVGLTKVVGREVPLTWTMDPFTKLLPLAVWVKAGPHPANVLGAIEESVGAG